MKALSWNVWGLGEVSKNRSFRGILVQLGLGGLLYKK